jgi:hypothetical protein
MTALRGKYLWLLTYRKDDPCLQTLCQYRYQTLSALPIVN